MQKTTDEPYEDIDKKINAIMEEKMPFDPTDLSPELKRTEENLRFVKKIRDKPIKKDKHAKTIFCYERFDPLTQVFGDNIWNRSIFAVDELNDMFFSATLEQQQKYVKKKRKPGMNMMFILILLLGAMIVIFFIFLFMSGMMGG